MRKILIICFALFLMGCDKGPNEIQVSQITPSNITITDSFSTSQMSGCGTITITTWKDVENRLFQTTSYICGYAGGVSTIQIK